MTPQHQTPPTNHYQPLLPQEVKVIEDNNKEFPAKKQDEPRMNANGKKRKSGRKKTTKP